ncbi:MAG: LLM class flavin-dependent oxidoreductase [Chloroflexi bacterium]|nr:LLM class flavin-dependent oxidoreductase [Chloroflexota bacterium]
MRLGLWLPTFTAGDPDYRTLPDRAREAEAAGFDGIYLLDHLLPIAGVHTSAWLDTVVGLTMLAVCTETVRIGTASMVAGFRHPVLLAKQLASVAALAGPRLQVGAGSGWYAPEYEALGYRIEERGRRTDETLEALALLLSGQPTTYHGRYWWFDDVTIAPAPEEEIPILVAGGSRTPNAGSAYDRPSMSPSVLRRILRWDGWISPCAGKEELTYHDLALVQRGLGETRRERGGFQLTHVQWMHVVDTDDRERALQEQLPRFRALMGEHHSDQHFIDTYLVGSRSDIQGRVRRLRDHGFDEVIIGPVTHDPQQTALIAEVVRPALQY